VLRAIGRAIGMDIGPVDRLEDPYQLETRLNMPGSVTVYLTRQRRYDAARVWVLLGGCPRLRTIDTRHVLAGLTVPRSAAATGAR
jgi:hypothetical protein